MKGLIHRLFHKNSTMIPLAEGWYCYNCHDYVRRAR